MEARGLPPGVCRLPAGPGRPGRPGAGAPLPTGLPVSPQVIFRFALALFKYKEEEILKLQDSMSIFKYLRYFTRTVLDARWVLGESPRPGVGWGPPGVQLGCSFGGVGTPGGLQDEGGIGGQ